MRAIRHWFTDTTGGLPRTFWYLWIVTLINRLGSFAQVYMTLYLATVRELPLTTVGLLVSLQGVGAIAGTQIAGTLADRWGRRRTLLSSHVLTLAVLLSLMVFTSLGAIAVLLVFFGASREAARPAFTSMIADIVPATERVRAFNLNYWAINVGFAVAALLAGVAATVDFRINFGVNALATGCAIALIFLKIPESRPTPTLAPREPHTTRTSRKLLHDKVFLVFVALSFVPAFMQTALFSMLPLQVTSVGLSEAQYGGIIAVNGIVIVLGQLFIPRLVRGARHTRVLAASAVLWTVGTAVTGLVDQMTLFMVAVAIWTLGEMLQTPAQMATVSELSPVDMRGRYQAVFALSFQVSTLLVPALGGIAMQSLGSGWWFLVAAFGAVAAVGNLLAEPSRERRLATSREPVTREPAAIEPAAAVDTGTDTTSSEAEATVEPEPARA